MKFFNFHTHNKKEEYGIINLFPQDEPELKRKYSIGFHPWYYSINYKESLEQIIKKINLSNVVAVGECGFDPKSPVNFDIQLEIFKEHIKISESYKKPLIIHCVKYYNELIKLKKEIKPEQPWVIHGFMGRIGMVDELLRHGFYFSISEAFLKVTEKFKKFFNIVSKNKLFLETDDKDYKIESIYNYAASELSISCNELRLLIEDNLKNIGIL